jgi:hypothetical protein
LGTLGNQSAGSYTVTVKVSDGQNTGTTTFIWIVNDITPPIIVNPGNQTSNLGSTVTLAVSASDADGDPLNWSAVNLPPGLSINPSTGLISGTLTGSTPAGTPYSVTLFVSDGQNTDSVSFLWTVN